MMNRRAFLCGLTLGTLSAPLAVEAQQAGKVYRIGYLSGASGIGPREEAFRQGLRDLTYLEGQNLVIDWRFAEGQEGRLAGLAAELVRLKPDAIITDGTPVTRAVKDSTRTIPIIMASDADPVCNGFVASLARPDRNITGLTTLIPGLSGKRLEVLREALPAISNVGAIWNPESASSAAAFKETQTAARALKVQLHSFEVRRPEDFERSFEAATRARAAALTVLSDALMFAHRAWLLQLVAKHRLATLHTQSLWVEAGGLMSYGTHFPDLHRRAAGYVDRVLRGAKPADLPVEQPTKFELVINLKTAKALGLTIPPTLLLQANQVIE
jgi:putative ABC transport system substrate-binding protein